MLSRFFQRKISSKAGNSGMESIPVNWCPELVRLIETVRPYTMTCNYRMASLFGMATEVARSGVVGDIVECGVWNGGTSAVMAAPLIESKARLWMYDTFEGLPAPTEKDGEFAARFTGACVGSDLKATEIVQRIGFPLDRVEVLKGKFCDTLPKAKPDAIAMLHIDADWYDSVLETLEALYCRVSEGGFVILDDFGFWEGSRRAFYEFCRRSGEEPLLERVGLTQAFWRKGRTHNRDLESHFPNGWPQNPSVTHYK